MLPTTITNKIQIKLKSTPLIVSEQTQLVQKQLIGLKLPRLIPSKQLIRPSEIELRQRMQEKLNSTQKKHTGTKFKTNLKLITTPAPQPLLFNQLKDTKCQSITLCQDDQCLKCYNASFASIPIHILSMWSSDNLKTPRQVLLKHQHEYWFDCPLKCGHRFFRRPSDIVISLYNKDGSLKNPLPIFQCPYCNQQNLCEDSNCLNCYNRSFATHPLVPLWSNHIVDNIKLNGDWTPRHIFPKGDFLAWFQCQDCHHVCEIIMQSLVKQKKDLNEVTNIRCCYCHSKRLCETHDCETCHLKSVASHEKMNQYWNQDKNKDRPHQVFLNCYDKYWFTCDRCQSDFEMTPNNISQGQWCPKCVNKTEFKLCQWLSNEFPHLTFIKDMGTPWCLSETTGKQLRFDFRNDDLKLIIELDGRQHFEQVENWESPDIIQKRDFHKMRTAISNGYSVIHLLQSDVFSDRNNWSTQLKSHIKLYDVPTCIFIKSPTGNHYDIYEHKWTLYQSELN